MLKLKHLYKNHTQILAISYRILSCIYFYICYFICFLRNHFTGP